MSWFFLKYTQSATFTQFLKVITNFISIFEFAIYDDRNEYRFVEEL